MWGILRYSSWRTGYISLGSVSYFISSWLFFGDQNIVNRIYLCSRISRRIVQQLHEYGNKDRPDSHMDRSDVMQFKSSSTKTQVPRSLAVCLPVRTERWTVRTCCSSSTKSRVPRSQPVRTLSNAPHQRTGESNVALGPSGRPIVPSERPVLNLIFHVYFK
jgi:hypothetical protein